MHKTSGGLLFFLFVAGCATPLPRPTPKQASELEVVAYQEALSKRVQEIKRDDRDACLVDEGGCGERAFRPPACAGDVGLTASTGLPTGYEGREEVVRLRGTLQMQGACTLLYCGEGSCCNGCGGALVVRLPEGIVVELEGAPAHRAALACVGDESMMCCGYKPDGQPVVVTGTLTARQGSEPAQPVVRDARLCTP